jgi:uncharacterized protein DUF955
MSWVVSLGSTAGERGRRAALRIVREWSGRMDSAGLLDLEALAEDLGVEIVRAPRLPVAGRWHKYRRPAPVEPRLWEEESEEIELVRMKTGRENTPARRFTLAHELGHAILDREMKGRSTELPVEEQEQFANRFAAELLLPDDLARSLRERFVGLEDVFGALELAHSVRVPPKLLLVRASRENWLEGMDVLWLDIRTTPNRYTGRDSRPRILDTVRDRARWFLPPNRSVRGVFGDDDWLARASRQLSTSGRIEISRLYGSPAKFVSKSVPAETLAFRMSRPGHSHGPEVLARVDLSPEDEDGQ